LNEYRSSGLEDWAAVVGGKETIEIAKILERVFRELACQNINASHSA
jgi:hypothetical protein